MSEEKVPQSTQEMKERLAEVLHPDYVWPEIPQGWQLEFVVYPDSSVEMDFLHPVSCVFWSEDNDFLELPTILTGEKLGLEQLIMQGVEYMTTFGQASVNPEPKPSHLKSVK